MWRFFCAIIAAFCVLLTFAAYVETFDDNYYHHAEIPVEVILFLDVLGLVMYCICILNSSYEEECFIDDIIFGILTICISGLISIAIKRRFWPLGSNSGLRIVFIWTLIAGLQLISYECIREQTRIPGPTPSTITEEATNCDEEEIIPESTASTAIKEVTNRDGEEIIPESTSSTITKETTKLDNKKITPEPTPYSVKLETTGKWKLLPITDNSQVSNKGSSGLCYVQELNGQESYLVHYLVDNDGIRDDDEKIAKLRKDEATIYKTDDCIPQIVEYTMYTKVNGDVRDKKTSYIIYVPTGTDFELSASDPQ